MSSNTVSRLTAQAIGVEFYPGTVEEARRVEELVSGFCDWATAALPPETGAALREYLTTGPISGADIGCLADYLSGELDEEIEFA